MTVPTFSILQTDKKLLQKFGTLIIYYVIVFIIKNKQNNGILQHNQRNR